MFSKPTTTFGNTTSNASFGFTNQPALFGQATFGKPQGFGSTPAFGATNNLFGGTAQQHTPLFGPSNQTPAFGQTPATTPAFGGNFFGGNAAQPSSSSLFGTTTTTSFGQQSKPAGFGFGNAATPGLFGQQAQATAGQPSSGTLFGQTAVAPSTGLFGSAGGFGAATAGVVGTTIKFNPVIGTDTMVKSGNTSTISTKHYSITCMKEYENKSFEELRYEDYLSNRKGAQQPGGQGLFGTMAQPVGGNLFGTATSASSGMFGAPAENKPAFGAASTIGGFGQPTSTFGADSQNNANIFKPFGSAATTSSTVFPFNAANTTSPFVTAAGAKPFGNMTQSSLSFGSNTTSTTGGFGTPGFGAFGANAQTGSMFGASKPGGFNLGTNTPGTTGYSSFGQTPAPNTATTMFPSNAGKTGFMAFSAPTTTPSVFGQPGGFGQPNQSVFNKPANTPFAPVQNSLGFNSTGLFGGAASKPGSLFGNTGSMFSSPFSTAPQNSTFGLGSAGMQAAPAVNPADGVNVHRNILLMTTPYGLNSVLRDLEPLDDKTPRNQVTNSADMKKLLSSYKISSARSASKLRPSLNNGLGKTPPPFFADLKDSPQLPEGDEHYNFRSNPRRLFLRQESQDVSASVTPPSDSSSRVTQKFRDSIYTEENCFSWMKSKGGRSPAGPASGFASPNDDSLSFSEDTGTVTPLGTGPRKVLFSSDVQKLLLFTEAEEPPDHGAPASNSSVGLSTERTVESFSSDLDATGDSDTASKVLDPADGSSGDFVPLRHPCGIVLRRPEYYTVPSLSDLPDFLTEDGKCVVTGFTIGRRGYGNVYFPDSMDVSNLDLDKIVHFRSREITIYPDDSDKPPIGHGLNRRAQITLERCWPKDAETREFIHDVDKILASDYPKKLARTCHKHITKFVEYRPETGSWVFKVEHFTKYGLTDSDDEDIDLPVHKPLAKTLAAPDKSVSRGLADIKPVLRGAPPPHLQQSQLSAQRNPLQEFRPSVDQRVESVFSNDPVKFSWMQHSLFGDELTNGMPSDVSEKSFAKTSRSKLFGRESILSPSSSSSQMEASEQDYITLPVKEVPVPCFTLPVVSEFVPMTESFCRERVCSDAALFKGRSFKVRFQRPAIFTCLTTLNSVESAGGSLLSKCCAGRSGNDMSPALLQRVQISNLGDRQADEDEMISSIEEHMQVQFRNSFLHYDGDVPKLTVNHSCDSLREHLEVARKLVQRYESSEQSLFNCELWSLCDALWGEVDFNTNECQHRDMTAIRKKRLSDWLENAVQPSVQFDLTLQSCSDPANTASRVMTLLSGHRIWEASTLSLEEDNPNLSVLLTQINTNSIAQGCFDNQIESWHKCSVERFIDRELVKVYLLLAGRPSLNSSIGLVDVCEKLDWKRAFGMYLWYIAPQSAPLSLAVELYEKAVLKMPGVPFPSPPDGSCKPGAYNLAFHLLKYFCNKCHPLESVLNPATHTLDPLDHSLSWLLLQTLEAIEFFNVGTTAADSIRLNLAAQLEAIGLWHWAVFVLLYLDGAARRKHLVQELLLRHVHMSGGEEYARRESMLVRQLGVPVAWIYEAKAVRAMSARSHHDASWCLIKCGRWAEAHSLIIEHIAPDAIVNENLSYLAKLLIALEPGRKSIATWANEGELLLNYIDTMKETELLQPEAASPKLDARGMYQMEQNMLSICRRMSLCKASTVDHVLQLSEMSKRIAHRLYSLLAVVSEDHISILVQAASFISALNMPPDYVHEEILRVIDSYVIMHEGINPKGGLRSTRLPSVPSSLAFPKISFKAKHIL